MSSENNKDEFDNLLTSIGFGRWQSPIILSTLLIAFLWPTHLIGSSLLSAPMAFHCSGSPQASAMNNTAYDVSFREKGEMYFDSKCMSGALKPVEIAMKVNNSGISDVRNVHFTGLPTCPYVEYDTSIFRSTVFSQWHLVCERSGLRPLFQMMANIGGLIGSYVGGYIGDRFGRKRAILFGCVGNMLAVIAMSFVPWYPALLALRVTVGIVNMSALLPAWSLALESTPSRHRSIVGMLMGLPYSAGVITLAFYGYLVRTWYYLLLIGSAPALVLLPLSFFVDESPSWLIQKGRTEDAKKVLEHAVRRNKGEISTAFATNINKVVETSTKPTSSDEGSSNEKERSSLVAKLGEVRRYMRSPGMRNIFLLTPVLWFLQSCLYLSVSINTNNFTSTGPFLYVALTGAMDGTAILLSTPLATRIGRKIIIFTGMCLGAILFLVVLAIPEEQYWARWIVYMAGFLSVGGTFQLNFVYAPELFPTEIRARGFAFVNVMGNLGFICAPLVTEILARYTWWAANAFFGCAGILGSLTVPFLPETRNKPLPETLQDVEDRRNKTKKRKGGDEKALNSEGQSEEAV